MSGRRHKIGSIGIAHENCAQTLIERIASLVKVPHEKDFGIDFYCQPLISDGPDTETVTELCAIQVKGGREGLTYGGFGRGHSWREYHFAWLRSLATPLYLARVTADLKAVELFSLWPLWWLFCSKGVPFKVNFKLRPAGKGHHWLEPIARAVPEAATFGDGKKWTVDLGPPFLRLTDEELSDSGFRERCVSILRMWISLDRLTLIRYLQSFHIVTGVTGWGTNQLEGLELGVSQFWNRLPGRNIGEIVKGFTPILENLVLHLKDQNDPAALTFIPPLLWLDSRGELDPIGKGLLGELQSRAASIGLDHGSFAPPPERDL